MILREATSLVKIVAVMEAGSVTGPAKNLLHFCRSAIDHHFQGLPLIDTSILTFRRGPANQAPDLFVDAALNLNLGIEVIQERFRFDPQALTDLRRTIRRLSPDLIQTHNVKSHFLIRLSGLWREIPWVAFHHGYTTTDWKMRSYNQLDRWSLPKAHRVVTMNKMFADQLVRAGARESGMRILHNAVDLTRVENTAATDAVELKTRLGISTEEKVILAIGRLSSEKGHSDLIKAYAILRRARPDHKTRLVLVGDGPEREPLQQEAAACGVTDQVIFTGQVKEVQPFYAIADLMVLPSHSEGSPNVLLEAMAARVPAVATAVGGVPEIAAHNETALLVDARHPQTMAEAIARLLDDRAFANRLAENAQEQVRRRHTPEMRLRSLLELYGELVPQRAVAAAQLV